MTVQNQIYIGDIDRRHIVSLLLRYVDPNEIDAKYKDHDEVTIEDIENRGVYAKTRLNVTSICGRPLYVSEEQKILDLRKYLEYVGGNRDRIIREIGQQVRKWLGTENVEF